MVEVEIKAWIDDFRYMERLLAERGEFIRNFHKRDVYYRVRGAADVRIRVENEGNAIATRKQKSVHDGMEFNREIEFTVDNPAALEQLLLDLGATERLRKEKTGVAYEIDGLLVELSEVATLGNFIEIEWISETEVNQRQQAQVRERIQQLAAEFGITPERFEGRSYTKLLRKRSPKRSKR